LRHSYFLRRHPSSRRIAPGKGRHRKVLVDDSRQSKLLYTVSLDDNGNYHIVLKPGTYVIDINHAGIDRSTDVPKTVEIKPGITVTLNISIDTGLR
jgi:hypothetical protein